ELQAWHNLIKEVKDKWPPPDDDKNAYDSVPFGSKQALIDRVSKLHPKDTKAISDFVEGNFKIPKGRPPLTGEEVENIKNLIQQEGRLEFRILANNVDDREAIEQATKYIGDEAHAAELERLALLGEPPPPPRTADGSQLFSVTLNGETKNYGY